MFGKCKKCNSEVGYFKLTDGICNLCLKDEKTGKFYRISKSMPILTWLFPVFVLFQLSSAWIFQAIVLSSPDIAAIMDPIEIKKQFLFSIILLIILFIPLGISFIIRFFIVRRRLSNIFAWITFLLLFSLPFGIITAVEGRNYPAYTTIIFLIVAFKILRLKNIINIETESIKKEDDFLAYINSKEYKDKQKKGK